MTYIAKKQHKKSAILTGKTDKRFFLFYVKKAYLCAQKNLKTQYYGYN